MWQSNQDAFGSRDWQYWSKYSFKIACCEKIGFALEPEFRFKNNVEQYYYSKTYFGLFYSLNKLIKIEAYYAYKAKKDNTVWRGTDLLYLDPTLKFNLRGIDLNTRFRLEYDFDKKELVYRNRLRFEKKVYKSIAPFIQEEAFYSFLSHKLEENRLSLGFSLKVLEKTSLSGEYMLNSKKANSLWQKANVILTKLSFLF